MHQPQSMLDGTLLVKLYSTLHQVITLKYSVQMRAAPANFTSSAVLPVPINEPQWARCVGLHSHENSTVASCGHIHGLRYACSMYACSASLRKGCSSPKCPYTCCSGSFATLVACLSLCEVALVMRGVLVRSQEKCSKPGDWSLQPAALGQNPKDSRHQPPEPAVPASPAGMYSC